MEHCSLDEFCLILKQHPVGSPQDGNESWRRGRMKVNTNMKSFRL